LRIVVALLSNILRKSIKKLLTN